MEIKRKYPIGIQTFDHIIEDGYIYVDKTDLVYKLVSTGKVYFLNRPRRFGKSLLLSTLRAYFEGKKELFKGLAIEKLEKEWIKYPVLRMDFCGKYYKDREALLSMLNITLDEWEREYGIERKYDLPEDRFSYAIEKIFEQTGKKVVILIDEYDKPMLEVMDNEELSETYSRILRGFYGVLKFSSRYLRFAFLTGVTKFKKLFEYGDMNQLEDISLTGDYSALCGFTEEEMHHYFGEDIRIMAEEMSLSCEDVLGKLREQYDGYRFSEAGPNVYNPITLLNVFDRKEFSDYWFQTGWPELLVKLLQRSAYCVNELEGAHAPAVNFTNYRAESSNPIPVFYQSGYLTIKGYAPETRLYTLGYPNREVYKGFLCCLNKCCFPMFFDRSIELLGFKTDIQNNDIESFMTRFRRFVNEIDHSLFDGKRAEHNCRYIFTLIFSLMDLGAAAEINTSDDRMDALITTDKHIYIFEFKLDRSAEEALKQIDMKRYGDRFAADPRPIVKVGASFSTKHRTLEKWVIK